MHTHFSYLTLVQGLLLMKKLKVSRKRGAKEIENFIFIFDLANLTKTESVSKLNVFSKPISKILAKIFMRNYYDSLEGID